MAASKKSAREVELWRRWQSLRSTDARDELVALYLPKVEGIVRGMTRVPLIDDVISAAREALAVAVERWDPNQCASFRVYAATMIRQRARGVARHVLGGRLKAGQRPAAVPFVVEPEAGPEGGASAEVVELARMALDALDGRELAAVIGSIFEGKTYQRLAVEMDVCESTVFNDIRSAIRRMRLALVGKC